MMASSISEQEPAVTLRAARKSAGMSVDDVAQRLNLLVSHVEAMETNDYSRFNAALFVRGYVRSYARLLGIPDAALVKAAEDRLQQAARGDSGQQPRKVVPADANLRVVLALALAVIVWMIAVLLSEHEESAAVSLEALPGLVDPLPFEVVTPLGATLLERANSALHPKEAAHPASAVPARLRLVFSEDCWVKVSNYRGEVLLAGLSKKGEDVVLDALGPLEIVLAYWPAVKIQLNGAPVSIADRVTGNAARIRVGAL